MHTNAFDEALALPTEASARLALRTQQVLAHESGIGDIVDPLGGAYAVESLTREIEKRAEEHLARIDEMGGMVAAIEQAWPQREIAERAWEYQRAIETREKIIVGVNEFQIEEAPPSDLLAHRRGAGEAAGGARRRAAGRRATGRRRPRRPGP